MRLGSMLAGFIAGVGAAMLFASRSGKKESAERLEAAKETMVSEGGKEPFYESGKYT